MIHPTTLLELAHSAQQDMLRQAREEGLARQARGHAGRPASAWRTIVVASALLLGMLALLIA